MCTLNYTPCIMYGCSEDFRTVGPSWARCSGRGRFMLIYSRFTWTLKTVNTRIRNTKHYSKTCIVTNIDCSDNKWQIIWKTMANNLYNFNQWLIKWMTEKPKSHDAWVLRTETASILSPDNDMKFRQWKLSINIKQIYLTPLCLSVNGFG